MTAALVATAGCTSDPAERGADPVPSSSVETETTLDARPVPLEVGPTRTFGGPLRKQRVRVVERQVGALAERYLDAAYLGDYPRGDFRGAFRDFARGADTSARADAALLTNAAAADRIEAATPVAKRLRLEMLVHRRRVAGVTARLRLVFREERVTGRDLRVTVAGRLLLTPHRRGGWQVFGYDIARAATPAGRGTR